MKVPYLIQIGTIDNIKYDQITGIDSLITFEYMGSSEFEFGALPKSLKRIRENWSQYKFDSVILKQNGKTVKYKNKAAKIFFCGKKEDLSDIDFFIKQFVFSPKNIHTKEPVRMREVFFGDELFNRKFEYNFWWDIENDWFAFIGEEKYFKKAIEVRIDEK